MGGEQTADARPAMVMLDPSAPRRSTLLASVTVSVFTCIVRVMGFEFYGSGLWSHGQRVHLHTPQPPSFLLHKNVAKTNEKRVKFLTVFAKRRSLNVGTDENANQHCPHCGRRCVWRGLVVDAHLSGVWA